MTVYDWKHPQLEQWEKEDYEATASIREEEKARDAASADITKLETEMKRYRYEHETLPRTERKPHDEKVSDMQWAIREAWRTFRAQWPAEGYGKLSRALAARKAARAAEEGPLVEKIDALKQADRTLRDLKEQDDNKAIDQQLAEATLTRIKSERAQMGAYAKQVSGNFAELAAALGFEGQPSTHINATETEVAEREFERASA